MILPEPLPCLLLYRLGGEEIYLIRCVEELERDEFMMVYVMMVSEWKVWRSYIKCGEFGRSLVIPK